MSNTTIHVTGGGDYNVTIGRGMLADPEAFFAPLFGPAVNKVLIIHPPTMGAIAQKLREQLMGEREVLSCRSSRR